MSLNGEMGRFFEVLAFVIKFTDFLVKLGNELQDSADSPLKSEKDSWEK